MKTLALGLCCLLATATGCTQTRVDWNEAGKIVDRNIVQITAVSRLVTARILLDQPREMAEKVNQVSAKLVGILDAENMKLSIDPQAAVSQINLLIVSAFPEIRDNMQIIQIIDTVVILAIGRIENLSSEIQIDKENTMIKFIRAAVIGIRDGSTPLALDQIKSSATSSQ